jgi:hypothetical protein
MEIQPVFSLGELAAEILEPADECRSPGNKHQAWEKGEGPRIFRSVGVYWRASSAGTPRQIRIGCVRDGIGLLGWRGYGRAGRGGRRGGRARVSREEEDSEDERVVGG